MKHFLLFFFLISMSAFSFGQTATSIANGNWISPGTWQGGVVPTPGYDVIINHDVTLGTSWAFSSGSITINAGGSLSQTTTGLGMLISSTGIFTNHGTFSFSKLAFTSTTVSSNTGTMQNLDSLYVGCDFNNSGTITASAFLPKTVFTNSGTVNATNLFNDGTFTNTGTMVLYNLFNNDTMTNNNSISFYDHTNAVTFYNYGTMTGTGNMTNSGIFVNNNSGSIHLTIDFSNVDSLSHDAYFVNNGLFTIDQNMTNIDTLAGTSDGQYCIGLDTYNSGVMEGSFDFCDNTPPANAPFIDFNTGTISPNIVWCVTPCGTYSGNISDNKEFLVYPNPSEFFNIENPFNESVAFTVYSPDGRLVAEYNLLPSSHIRIDNLPAGIYLYSLKGSSIYNGKMIKL